MFNKGIFVAFITLKQVDRVAPFEQKGMRIHLALGLHKMTGLDSVVFGVDGLASCFLFTG